MTILQEAQGLVSGDRNTAYGHPAADFQRIAQLWSAYLGYPVDPRDVGMLLVLMKVARERHSHRRDNLVDIAGYAYCNSLLEPENPAPEFEAAR